MSEADSARRRKKKDLTANEAGKKSGQKRKKPSKKDGKGSDGAAAAASAGADAKPERKPIDPKVLAPYLRGEGNVTDKLQNKKLKTGLSRSEQHAKAAQARAAAAELLLPEEAGYVEAEGMEATFKFKQANLRAAVDLNTAKTVFDFNLPDLGPYSIDYTRNGRWLVLGGRKGHLAMIDALRMDVQMEVQLGEEIKDVCTLHNEGFVAVAQRKYTYMYDNQGAEVHCLRQHLEPNALQFLPYHFLLASIGRTGFLKYHDISTGTLVAEHRTKLGSCSVMRQNPRNAVLHLGHANGVVTLWSPVVNTPLVRMLTHKGPVTSLAVDATGHHMVTAGQDGQVKVWDLRTYKELHAYFSPAPPVTMDISQRGMLALGYSCHVAVWKDAISQKAKAPYLQHSQPSGGRMHSFKFRPFEDTLGVGHHGGYSTLLAPGAGEPNIDTFAANPFESSKQRREGEVRALLDKLLPETISLDESFVGTVDDDGQALQKEQKAIAEAANTREQLPVKAKNKMRGRNKIAKKLQKKQSNVIDAGVLKLREKLAAERGAAKASHEEAKKEKEKAGAPSALAKFFA